jgi:hypothetical protein
MKKSDLAFQETTVLVTTQSERTQKKTDGRRATKRRRMADQRKVTVYNQATKEAAVMYASGTEHPKGGNSIAFRTAKGAKNVNAAAVALIEGVIGAGKLPNKTRLPRGDASDWHKTVPENSRFFDVFDMSGGQVIF